jgi:phage protein D
MFPYTPAYQITANSADITAAIQSRFVSMTIHDEIGINSDQVEIELDDRDGSIATPAFGADLQIAIGYVETGLVAKGQWRVDEVEFEGPERKVVIRARSADTNSSGTLPQIKQLRTQSWVGMNIGQIAGQMASRAGLGLQIDATLASAVPYTDQQTNQSDLQWLIEAVGDQPDGAVKVANGILLILRQGTGTSVSGAPMATIAIAPSDCLRWRCLLTRRAAHKKVTARWVDPNGYTNYETAASSDADDEDSDTEAPEDYPDQNSADAAANADVNEYARNAEGVSLTLVGNPKIASGMMLSLSGFRQSVDDTWNATRVTHTINESGYITEAECQKDISGGDSDSSG